VIETRTRGWWLSRSACLSSTRPGTRNLFPKLVPEIRKDPKPGEREFFIDNLLVRIYFIIEVIWWTGLASWEFESPFSGSFTSTFLAKPEHTRNPKPRVVAVSLTLPFFLASEYPRLVPVIRTHSKPETRNPNPRNPAPWTLMAVSLGLPSVYASWYPRPGHIRNPKFENRNSKPGNPKPEIRNLNPELEQSTPKNSKSRTRSPTKMESTVT